jgi:GTP-binding protein SAR1
VPIVILGNKIDKVGAVPEHELREVLGIEQKGAAGWRQGRDTRPIEVFMCSVAKKIGYSEGFRWLSSYIT